jgi:hypothetical protein
MQPGRYIAHKFESGWEVGVIKAFDKKGPHAGKFSVKYKDGPSSDEDDRTRLQSSGATKSYTYWNSSAPRTNDKITGSAGKPGRGLNTTSLSRASKR